MLLSIIIPLSSEEKAWQDLLEDLARLTIAIEIILVYPENTPEPQYKTGLPNQPIRWIASSPGRAAQMNAGALVAKSDHLWFLHADSRFGKDTMPQLLAAIQNYPDALLFFDLVFMKDASCLIKLNEWGVRFRSRKLKVPFGDQGICIRKYIFQQLNGFPTHVPYGEDHLFVWKARQQGIAIQAINAKLYTSARKYRQHGWLKTTLLHQYLWIKQAWPEWKKLRKQGVR